ncbi:sigma-70 family RNA polymerase sigma factor [Cohnella sp. CFH 77786]|uniref:sigma-70 family RNA polymerase sigma factor n=1 Tax=Cohnella sp. CFH 77786 TaxID=2662265 RepID=UPI001C60B5DC|nr:sigma-70 family RNA polymerase sigma factor [Cohnella sp. CFH 77786]MBW5447323.1 sigma-70 family RNA polymerase sigma factor [Cohnella sp. CFH 77786]
MSDEQWVRAAQRGDPDAFHRLVSEHGMKLYSVAYAYLKNEADALEAVQEATCRAYVKLGKLKEPRYFHTWLTRILIHCCIDEQKRKRGMLPLFSIPDTLVADLALDEKLRLQLAIDSLPPNLRHIIILKYYEDMTLTEIAKLLEKPEGTVKTWLNKALNELRATFRKEGESGYA